MQTPIKVDIPDELKVILLNAIFLGPGREMQERIADGIKIYVTQKLTSLYLRGVTKNQSLDEIADAFGIEKPDHRIGE